MRAIKSFSAGALALAAACLTVLHPTGTAQAQSADAETQGILTARWGDPHRDAGAGGGTFFSLTYPDGSRIAVDVAPALQNEAIRLTGKRVTLRGAASGDAGARRFSASGVAPAAAFEPQAAPVTGKRKVLFILLKFKGDDQQPHPADFFKKLTNPLKGSGEIPATINGFFDKASYGKFQWSGTVAGGKWYTLPKARTEYANCGSSSACFAPVLDTLGDDAVALVRNDVDVNAFDNINFVFNNDLDCCAWGGSYSNGARFWGATWEPPWGQETSVYVHEMGHSLGLPHSGWRYFAYDSNHDEMSRGSPAASVTCGRYNSVNFGGPNTSITCTEPGGGYIMAHQNFLGWIPDANKAVVSTVKTKTFNVQANSQTLGSKLKLVIVCLQGQVCDPAQSTARYLTIEAKTKSARYDKAVPSEGVVIHDVKMNRDPVGGGCYFNSQSGWAMPFDATPGDYNASTCSGVGLRNMAYAPGTAFDDATLGVKVEVLEKTGDVYKVRVTKSK